jgi:hypothetical protein
MAPMFINWNTDIKSLHPLTYGPLYSLNRLILGVVRAVVEVWNSQISVPL